MPRVLALVSLLALAGSAPSLARADVRELVGRPAPPIRARALDSDGSVDLGAYRGRVVLLAFVATWCAACRRMAPELEELGRAHGGDGLTILALSHEARDRIRAHAAQAPRTYATVQCTGRTARRYQASGLPTLVLVDRAGVVRGAYQGATPEIVRRLRRDIGRVLSAR